MGRTVATFTQMLDSYQQRWHKVRRALRQADQQEWDRLFESARLNIQAGMYAAAPEPKESIFISMLLGLSQRITALEADNQALRAQLYLPASDPITRPFRLSPAVRFVAVGADTGERRCGRLKAGSLIWKRWGMPSRSGLTPMTGSF